MKLPKQSILRAKERADRCRPCDEADAEDPHLMAAAVELAHADKEAGHADTEAEAAQLATEAAHVVAEALDAATWAAEHTVHDIDNSAELAHGAVTDAHNITETIEPIEMLEHSK